MLYWKLVLRFIRKLFYFYYIFFIINCKELKRPDLLLTLLLNRGEIGIITSDFSSSGRFYTLNNYGFLSFNYTPIHSDATGFYLDNKVFIINRLNRDSLQVLDPFLFYVPVGEYSLGNGTNPHGIAVFQNKAYITLYEKNYILVIDKNTGVELKKIDISSYTDTQSYFFPPDGIPEASGIVYLNNKIYVALQRLDRTNPYQIFPVTDYSLLLEIDPVTDIVVQTYTFQYKNPFSKLKVYNIFGEDCIFVANAGNIGFNFAIDGAIEGFCPSSLSRYTLLKEEDVGGDILDFVIVNGSIGFASILYQDFSSRIIKFHPSLGIVLENVLYYKNSGFAAGLEINENFLYIGESSNFPLIRILDIYSLQNIQIVPLEQRPTEIFMVK